MAGISHVLNIAKEALLTHQVSVQVASHNVANVDTPGYTRQTLGLTTPLPSPSLVGNIGGGVKGESISRKYDRFMTQRIMDQYSLLSSLESQEQSMRVVETIFNEATGLGLNDLMSQFWESWQNVANNPEIVSARQTVVQQGLLIIDQLQHMNSEIAEAKYNITLSLDQAMDEVNTITSQIADLNLKISSSETQANQANDLRDRRDLLVQELSKHLDITYFEDISGGYTVMLPDGHSIVDDTDNWDLAWLDNKLYWLSEKSDGTQTQVEVAEASEIGGRIGGWLETRAQLIEGDPNNYLGKLDAFTNSLIREINQQHSQGVGMVSFADGLVGTEIAANTALLTGTIDAATATDTIGENILKINNRQVGEIAGAAAMQGLAMGKAYNAVTAINNAITGVRANLTTLVAGNAVAVMPDASTISFDVNGINVSYTVDYGGSGDNVAATFAANLVAAIDSAISANNADPTIPIDMSLDAVVGDGTNGGAIDSVVLRNTNQGDESQIVISNIVSVPPGLETSMGLTAGTYTPDATHNTGEIALFSDKEFMVEAGPDDTYLTELGMGGGVHPDDVPNDGKFQYGFDNGGIQYALEGYKFADQLATDGGSFDIWFYNSDGTLPLPQPVTVSIERAYTLQDVVNAINVSVTNASGGAAWLAASIQENKIVMTPDTSHTFALANDASNFLQVAGINTLFTGYNAGTLGINETVQNNLEYMAAGTVTTRGEIFRGDNTNALNIINIQYDENVVFTGGSTNTLDDFYSSLVGEIGIRSKSVIQNREFHALVLDQLQELRDATSGVSVDEEMANLIKFQHAYAAAAKLVTTADEMFMSLLDSLRR